MQIKFDVPVPVSVNAAYNNARSGRTKTAAAKKWFNAACHTMMPIIWQYKHVCDENIKIRQRFMTGKKGRLDLHGLRKSYPALGYGVHYRFYFKDDGLRDVFNFEKLLTDWLCWQGFLLDDNFILDGRVSYATPDKNRPRVEVEIITLDRSNWPIVQK